MKELTQRWKALPGCTERKKKKHERIRTHTHTLSTRKRNKGTEVKTALMHTARIPSLLYIQINITLKHRKAAKK